MKLRFSIIYILFFSFSYCFVINAQVDVEKSSFFMEVGRPTHTDMDFNEKRLLIGINYKRNFSKTFNWAFYVKRISANSELDFFNDKSRLLDYVNSSEEFGIGARWSRIETYVLGGSLNLVFINKENHYFSLNFGAGFYTSNSSSQSFQEVTTESTFTPEGELIGSEITDFTTATDRATKSELFILPSIQYHYVFDNKMILGIGVDFLLDQDSQAITSQPVLANFYSFNLLLGKKF